MSRRMEKVDELLQQELSQILQKEMSINKEKFFVTIQKVKTVKDLKTATVWVSIFSSRITEAEQRKFIKQLQKKSFEFQKILGQRLDLKFIPRLRFELDTSAEILQKIDEIIDKSSKGL